VSRSIRSAQTQIEQQNFEIRKNVLKYDEVLNKQRTVIYEERRRVLLGEDIHEQVVNMIEDVIRDYVSAATSEGYEEDWDVDTLWTALKQLYPVSVTLDELEQRSGGGLSSEYLQEELVADAMSAYERRESELGSEVLRELERRVILSVLDRKWREHLYEMDYLQEGIGLRSYGQRDPLVEYQREAFDMFTTMMDGIKEESVGFLFNVEVQLEQAPAPPSQEGLVASGPSLDEPTPAVSVPESPAANEDEERQRVADVLGQVVGAPKRPANLSYTAPTVDGEGGVARSSGPAASGSVGGYANVSRNAPCPCGSGRKFKRCHGAPDAR